MNYQRFKDEQEALHNISLAYKNNPEFKQQLDTNPRSIFCGELGQESECEIAIMHNGDGMAYFILPANIEHIMDDDEVVTIAAAKMQYSSFNDTTFETIYYNDENRKYYKRYKGDPTDPQGKTHFTEVSIGIFGGYTEMPGVVVINS